MFLLVWMSPGVLTGKGETGSECLHYQREAAITGIISIHNEYDTLTTHNDPIKFIDFRYWVIKVPPLCHAQAHSQR